MKIIHGLRAIVDVFLVTAFILMFGAVLAQVAVRTFTPFSIVGTEEIANYSQLWLVMMGAGVALRFGRHVAVDVLVTLIPKRVRSWIQIINAMFIFWFLALVFKGSLPLIDMGAFQKSPALGLPMWAVYASLAAGAVYMMIELVLSLFCPEQGAEPVDQQTIPEQV
ncbi:TRAP transporter small permease [Castellaniella sp.]|uniref:TRAP transporter small permease n=1 Tax=Castellaniella sp. TaxID=1955812 RepID=UPI003C785021